MILTLFANKICEPTMVVPIIVHFDNTAIFKCFWKVHLSKWSIFVCTVFALSPGILLQICRSCMKSHYVTHFLLWVALFNHIGCHNNYSCHHNTKKTHLWQVKIVTNIHSDLTCTTHKKIDSAITISMGILPTHFTFQNLSWSWLWILSGKLHYHKWLLFLSSHPF